MQETQLLSTQILNYVTIGYFVSMISFLVYLVVRNDTVALVAKGVTWLGFIVQTFAIGYRWYESYQMGEGVGHAPLSNLYESVVFFAWTIILIYILLDLKYKQPAMGAFVIPFAFFGIVWAQFYLPSNISPLLPALQSNWLTYHVITCFLGYAAFAVACGVSIMYLIKVYSDEGKGGASEGGVLPAAKILDDINYKAIMIGFPLLTLGIVTGAAWANYAWGTYWSWDPKETWSLIVWFIYAAFLHARFTRGWAGKKAAILSIVGFLATIFCYLGVNLVLSGLHSYGGN